MLIRPQDLKRDLNRLEDIEKASLRLVVQAIVDFRQDAVAIFREESDLVAIAGTGPRNVMWINSGALLGQDIQKTTAVAAPVVAPPVPLPAPAQTWTPPIAAAPMVPAQTWSPPPPVPSREKTVHVDGYYKRDGTYVRPHNRRPPSR